jgi:hypothetical protein
LASRPRLQFLGRFAIGGDPERTGLVTSLGRPGGNLTGAVHINVEIAPSDPARRADDPAASFYANFRGCPRRGMDRARPRQQRGGRLIRPGSTYIGPMPPSGHADD